MPPAVDGTRPAKRHARAGHAHLTVRSSFRQGDIINFHSHKRTVAVVACSTTRLLLGSSNLITRMPCS